MNLPNKPMNLAGAFNASPCFCAPCTRRLIAAAAFSGALATGSLVP